MKSRAYHQQARALTTEATRAAVLDALDALFSIRPGLDFSLDAVAQRAGTTVQTTLRHFGSKAGLLEAGARRARDAIQGERDGVPAGDLPAIVAYLARHYENTSGMVLRMIAMEHEVTEVGEIVRQGRAMHRAWVERVLSTFLEERAGAERRRRLAMLVAVTDVLTWKVLRQEQGLSQRAYERSVRELLEALQ